MSYYHLCFDRVSALTLQATHDLDASTSAAQFANGVGRLYIYYQALSTLSATLPPKHPVHPLIEDNLKKFGWYGHVTDAEDEDDTGLEPYEEFDSTWKDTLDGIRWSEQSHTLQKIHAMLNAAHMDTALNPAGLMNGIKNGYAVLIALDARSLAVTGAQHVSERSRAFHLRLN